MLSVPLSGSEWTTISISKCISSEISIFAITDPFVGVKGPSLEKISSALIPISVREMAAMKL